MILPMYAEKVVIIAAIGSDNIVIIVAITSNRDAIGRSTTAWLPTRDRPVVAMAPYKGATGCGQGPLHKGRLVAASPQGRQALAGTVASSAAPTGAAANGQAAKAAPARGEATGAAPDCREAAPTACTGVATATTQRGKRRS
ncbi:hypothetical protein GW17_00045279 [Ensete ventricosum]|nr:hypothetical protein GW17_00045279 [Ensete ventricosum]